MSHRPDGRWNGRLTSKPLPEVDETIEALPTEARRELADHWLARAASERRVADAFAVVHDALVESRAPEALIALAHRAVDDEYRHTELAREVASRFAGHALAEPERLTLVVPAHRNASPELRRALHVLGHCALNETFASAVLEAALRESTGSLARAALRELLSDEIDHARIGWAYLATLAPEARQALVPFLPELLDANLRSWRTSDRAYPSDRALVAHGALTAELIEEALATALRTLVFPGFAHLGMPTDQFAGWMRMPIPR